MNVRQIQFSRTGENITYKSSTDSLKSFIAFTTSNSAVPIIKPIAVQNQDLHSSVPADMIIVTHPLFRTYAEKLAEIHLKNEGLVTQIVTPVQIYNEFSGGIPDICAIRNFLRMKYLKQKDIETPAAILMHGIDIAKDFVVSLRTTTGVKQTLAMNSFRKIRAVDNLSKQFMKESYRFAAAIGLALRTK